MHDLFNIREIMESGTMNALLVFIAIIIFAKIVDLFLDKVVRRLTERTRYQLDEKIVDLIHRPVFFTIIIAGAVYTIEILQPSARIVLYSTGILNSLLTLIWGITILRIGNLIMAGYFWGIADITGLNKEVAPLFENIWKLFMTVATIMVILSIWSISITPLLASAGIMGAAVAFAAKDTIANFIGGISIYIDKPYKIGDYIVLDRDERGEVVEIGIRSTRIKTRDDILISIPNSLIANSKIINESAPIPNFRVRIPVGVAYESDIDLVDKTLLEVASQNENVLSDPEPRVRLREFGDSSINFELLCWARDPSLRGVMVNEINRMIFKKFRERGIRIPFPQRDVHFYGNDVKHDI